MNCLDILRQPTTLDVKKRKKAYLVVSKLILPPRCMIATPSKTRARMDFILVLVAFGDETKCDLIVVRYRNVLYSGKTIQMFSQNIITSTYTQQYRAGTMSP